MPSGLTWGWCVATYKRHEVLGRALACVLAQSRPPAEVIVVDASPDWEAGRAQIAAVIERFRDRLPTGFRHEYLQAPRASLTAQRNHGIARASADVLFLIDDDSLLYPDAAAKVMAVYEDARAGPVQAIAPLRVRDEPPAPDTEAWDAHFTEEPTDPAADTGPATPPASPRSYSGLAKLLRGWLHADDLFVPYDPAYAMAELADGLADDYHLAPRELIAGYCLTCRRSAALAEPFEGRLERYCPGEDSDMAHRVSTHGPMACRLDAFLCHVEAPSGRLDHYPRTALGALNPILLHRVHGTDRDHSRRALHRLLRRRLMIEALKDVQAKDLTLPRARGIWTAKRAINRILASPDDALDALFARYQELAKR